MLSEHIEGTSKNRGADAGPVRYRTLDALRGVAALFVVARHCGPWVPQFSYLGVDMFFVLSGFVLAKANDRRFAAGMSGWEFLSRRVKRLYPLYALGLALGLISMLAPNPTRLSAARTALGVRVGGLGPARSDPARRRGDRGRRGPADAAEHGIMVHIL